MPRRFASHGGRDHGGSGSALAVEALLSKETSYRQGIKDNHTQALLLAEALGAGAPVEQAIDNPEFLQQQRERLKQVALLNAQNSRGVDTFISAVKELRQELKHDHDVDNDEDVDVDYGESLTKKLKLHLKENIPNVDHDYCREVRSRLGEKEKETDDDLEVLNQPGDSSQSLKCPITGVLFENPVKNKHCGHVYSKAGILQVIRLNKVCPVPGCPNQTKVSLSDLEEDAEMVYKVKRQKKREEQERQQRLTQAQDSEEEVL